MKTKIFEAEVPDDSFMVELTTADFEIISREFVDRHIDIFPRLKTKARKNYSVYIDALGDLLIFKGENFGQINPEEKKHALDILITIKKHEE